MKRAKITHLIICRTCKGICKSKKSLLSIKKYCSRKCAYSNSKRNETISKKLIGHKMSDEQRIKLSAILKGRKLSLEHKVKVCRNLILLKLRREHGPNWKGGKIELRKQVQNTRQYKMWRQAIFNRDRFMCVLCNSIGVYLNCDHIKPYSVIIKQNSITSLKEALDCKELFDVNNGRTLCRDCHKQTDTYGTKAVSYKP